MRRLIAIIPVLMLISLNGFAASITASTAVCLFFVGNCYNGGAVGGGAVFPGATGIGSQINNSGTNSEGTAWEATAAAVIDYGKFHAEVTAGYSSPVAGVGDFAAAHASAVQQEMWTVHDSTGHNAPGTLGLLQVSYTISGGSASSGGPDADVQVELGLVIMNNGPLGGSGAFGQVQGSGVFSLDRPLKFRYDIPFPVQIFYAEDAGVSVIAPSPFFDAFAGGFFQDTATLTGVQALDFSTGTPVRGAVLTGDSGTVYPLPPDVVVGAPEPSTLALFAAGFGFAVVLVRRRG
jgi:hypothetical protein